MNEVNLARWKLMGGIFIVIILVHAVAISCVVTANRDPAVKSGPTRPQSGGVTPGAAPGAQQPGVPPGVPVTVPGTQQPSLPVGGNAAAGDAPVKSGFWSRLFGGGSASVAPDQPASAATPPVTYRYRAPSANPLAYAPFDYSRAVTGDFDPKVIPNSREATGGILVDMTNRRVLWEKNSNRSVPVASMVKMMTLLVAFEALEANPALSLETPVKISPEVLKVQRTGIVWLDPRETFPLSDLMKASTIKSANDAAVQIALFFGDGSEENYVNRMNARALELGMTGSRFISACGLPDKARGNSVSTPRDMVILAERLMEYPKVMEWASTKLDFIREGDKRTMLNNTNNLINAGVKGVDGLKTGFINDSGYCLTFTVERDGRRLVGCVTGFKSARNGRDPFCTKLIDWGYKRAAELEGH